MKTLHFDVDKLFDLIDTYENCVRKGEIDGGNADIAYLLGAMKSNLEYWREDDLFNKFDKIVKVLNIGKKTSGVTQDDIAIISSWLGFMLGMLTAENMRVGLYDDDYMPPFLPTTEEDYEKAYDWE